MPGAAGLTGTASSGLLLGAAGERGQAERGGERGLRLRRERRKPGRASLRARSCLAHAADVVTAPVCLVLPCGLWGEGRGFVRGTQEARCGSVGGFVLHQWILLTCFRASAIVVGVVLGADLAGAGLGG